MQAPDNDVFFGALREAAGFLPPTYLGSTKAAASSSDRVVPGQRALRGLTTQGVGYVMHDANGRITDANSAAESILGLTLAQLQGRTTMDPRWALVHPDGRPMRVHEQPAMRVLADGVRVRGVEVGVHRPSVEAMDEHVWLSVAAEPAGWVDGALSPRGHLGEETGPVEGAVAYFTEVEPTRARWLRLEEAERRFRMLAEHSHDLIVLLDGEGQLRWMSPSVQRVLGWSSDELIGQRAHDLVHPDDTALLVSALEAAGGGAEARVRARHRSGQWRWMDFSARLVDGSGGVHGDDRVVVTARDASDKAVLEAERDNAHAELKALMDNAPIGMAVTDARGFWVSANASLCDMLGYTAEELTSMTFEDVTHPDDAGDSRDQFRRMLSGEITTCSSEKRYVRSDGALIWAQRTASRVVPAGQDEPLFVVQLVDVTERKRAQEVLAAQAVTDPLTGLPNRLVLADRLTHALARARRDGTMVAVIFCDLDWFKQVNDKLGHDAGDELLRRVAERIAATVREGDTAVRLGGDEFVVVCDDIVSIDQARRVAERVAEAIERPYQLSAGIGRVSVSIGIATGTSGDAETLLQNADAAMYRAKESGRAGIDVFDDAAQVAAAQQVALQRDLGRAITADELRLHYQPIVDLRSGAPVAYEALMRWQHPEQGMVMPDAFIPAAEHSRRIIELGDWSLRAACADAAAWRGREIVAVNVSARHLSTAHFAATVRQVLDETGLPADRLVLEITEASVLHASVSTLRSMTALAETGVSFHLDDFGTGQSSITALHRLTVRAIKIDRSFTASILEDRRAASLVRGLIQLAAGLDMHVVAEGVETTEQARWLADNDCTHVQGYLYGRPGPAVRDPHKIAIRSRSRA